jgi:hypothetical protein
MNEVKVIKKRGRKPKDKTDVSTKVIEDYVNANMILHIPLYDSINENTQSEVNSEMLSDAIQDDSLAPFDKNMMYMIEFNKEYNTETNKYMNYNMSFCSTTRKLYDTNNFFIENGNVQENVKSECVCFWDTEHFNTIPIGLPYKIVKNNDENMDMMDCKNFKYKYLVYGYFCGFSCAAAYNFSLKDSQMNQRFVLLNNLYEDVFNNQNTINIAPPREMLKKFGGSLSISEFRSRTTQSIQYQNIIPPLMSLRCQIEEFYGNLYKKNETTVITLDDERVNRAQNNIEKLRLKRNSGIHNSKNNIENRMGIRILNNNDN